MTKYEFALLVTRVAGGLMTAYGVIDVVTALTLPLGRDCSGASDASATVLHVAVPWLVVGAVILFASRPIARWLSRE